VTPEELGAEQERDLAWVLSTPQGRRALYRLTHDRELGMLMRTAAVPGDDTGTLRNLGRQDLARDLLALAERVDPNLFHKMMSEAHDPARWVSRSLVPQDGDSSP
jgi:hypothetical protein